MAHEPNLDGIYIDEASFARPTMQRMRRVLGSKNEIDFHSCNKLICPHDSKNTIVGASSLLIYMAHLSSIDKLWLGEGFPYSTALPDYWLVEMSGIPFGLMADTLGMPPKLAYRALVHGMMARPSPAIWKLCQEFDLEHAEVFGYWEAEPAVVVVSDTSDVAKSVLATAFVHKERNTALIVVASFGVEATVSLAVKWETLQIAPPKYIDAPAIKDLQPSKRLEARSFFQVSASGGLIVTM
mmetsp:Transcript_16355/g.35466  ORF Transcript_16355/g.35466 Transcript_16355/m.35466 type:complete len:240 (+) Transcript_16355:629-1348(+)